MAPTRIPRLLLRRRTRRRLTRLTTGPQRRDESLRRSDLIVTVTIFTAKLYWQCRIGAIDDVGDKLAGAIPLGCSTCLASPQGPTSSSALSVPLRC